MRGSAQTGQPTRRPNEMDLKQRFLNLILSRRYELTNHALESMDESGLALNDLLSCLATGRLRRRWPRQRKYEIEGRAADGRRVRLVGRLRQAQMLRIITVYEIQ